MVPNPRQSQLLDEVRARGPLSVTPQAQRAYLLRSNDDVIHTDIVVGFRVLRICDDGSTVIAYRILKEFPTRGSR